MPTDSVSAVTEAVRRGGGTVLNEPATRDQLGRPVTSAFCCDTEGNRFELTDAGLD